MNKILLVTGGAGFIGSHLSEALLKKGYRVRILDNLLYGKKEWIPKDAEFILGDITDPSICQGAMKNVTAVFHCAAMSRSAPSMDHIDLCTAVNILGTQNILTSAREAGVKKIIYSGSSTFYGSQPPPHREKETPGQFLNLYALTKYVGEKYCLLFDKEFNLPCVILRYFNVYGPRQPEIGNYALVLGIFLKRWLHNECLEIHGDGRQRRDFIHVYDVVSANIAAFENDIHHEIINIGSGFNFSIKEIANMISSNQKHVLRRAQDAESTLADISRAKTLLGWAPTMDLKKDIITMKNILKGEN